MSGLFVEDVGKLDRFIQTSGDAQVLLAARAGSEILVTSGEKYIAARSAETGRVLWRRPTGKSAVGGKLVLSSSTVYLREELKSGKNQLLRAWNLEKGNLVYELPIPSGIKSNSVFTFLKDNQEYLLVGDMVLNSDGKVESGIQVNEAKSLREDPEISCPLKVDKNSKTVSVNGETLQLPNVQDEIVHSVPLDETSLLVSTVRGDTSMIAVDQDKLVLKWTAHDGMTAPSQAILLDIPTLSKNTQAKEALSLSSRLTSQWNFQQVTHHGFGFAKRALLLANHRVYGIGLFTEDESTFTVDLPVSDSHVMVHGSPDHRELHTRDVLVLSKTGNSLVATCFDGTDGNIIESSTTKISSNIAQIISLVSTDGPCRQKAKLILSDNTVVSIGNVVEPELPLYSHRVFESKFETYRVSGTSLATIGTSSFPGEKVIATSYPNRQETVSSTSVSLGDDSLLLKYMNPHIAVVVTVVENPTNGVLSPVKEQKKTRGVEESAWSTVGSPSNLFVNVVDTVSGNVIYRIGHHDACLVPKPQVLVSENWVFYSFMNEKTRRTEIGVLSLYEGMIDKDGLTAFNTPEQRGIFTSFDADDLNPVVLAKSYSIPKGIQAIGITLTESGISGKKILLAGTDGQIISVDRKMLEPRRPLGKLKDSEKKEGLHQYMELIPSVPQMTLSHTYFVEGVTSIISASSDLESQSIILAYGGPDLFAARYAPSRGFDVLPNNFGKVPLALVVIGLVVTQWVLQGMASKKLQKQGWK